MDVYIRPTSIDLTFDGPALRTAAGIEIISIDDHDHLGRQKFSRYVAQNPRGISLPADGTAILLTGGRRSLVSELTRARFPIIPQVGGIKFRVTRQNLPVRAVGEAVIVRTMAPESTLRLAAANADAGTFRENVKQAFKDYRGIMKMADRLPKTFTYVQIYCGALADAKDHPLLPNGPLTTDHLATALAALPNWNA